MRTTELAILGERPLRAVIKARITAFSRPGPWRLRTLSPSVLWERGLSTCRVISTRMSSLDAHRRKAEAFRDAATKIDEPGLLVETWFLSAYHFIEACAAKQRVHIQKHQRVPDELDQNPVILGPQSSVVAEAFRYLDHHARAKFVYGDSGTKADLAKARRNFETIETACREMLG